MSLTYTDPMKDTPEGQLLSLVHNLEAVVKSKYNSTYNNMNCMNCSDSSCSDCKPKDYKSDRGDGPIPKLPSPKGNKNMKSKKGEKKLSGKQKELDKDGDGKIDGDDFKEMKKGDATTQFLRDRGIFVKYEQENSVNDQVPQLMEVSGSEQIRATVYSTNQRIPYMEDGNSPSPISEVAKMPYAAQTGYGVDGTSLHMRYNDGGGFTDNKDEWEEKLTQLKKAHPGKVGIIEEIASLTEMIYARL